MPRQSSSVGHHLREWRRRRRMSQLELACDAKISARHLSFVENGRSNPSREMILHLAEQLGVPTRERNVLLIAAGYAPCFPERSLDDPALREARRAIDFVLGAHAPFPAFALDRHWNVVASNGALPELYDGVAPALLQPPINVVRLSLHPHGLAPRISNLPEWRSHLLHRLDQGIESTADPMLVALSREVRGYRVPRTDMTVASAPAGVLVPLRVETALGTLSFISTTTVFGSPVDLTLSEIAIEAFFPADAATDQALRRPANPETPRARPPILR
jgi:transcriptional regulator with XRE-family HTH domain